MIGKLIDRQMIEINDNVIHSYRGEFQVRQGYVGSPCLFLNLSYSYPCYSYPCLISGVSGRYHHSLQFPPVCTFHSSQMPIYICLA